MGGSARATHSGSRTMTHGVGTACWLEYPHDRLKFNEVVVELNRISKDLDDEQNFENDEEQESSSSSNAEEQTPLIEENNTNATTTATVTSMNRSNGPNNGLFSILSNSLRQRRGE